MIPTDVRFWDSWIETLQKSVGEGCREEVSQLFRPGAHVKKRKHFDEGDRCERIEGVREGSPVAAVGVVDTALLTRPPASETTVSAAEMSGG